MENLRKQRGLQIVEKRNQVKRLDASTYRVRSQNGKGSYLVVIQGSEYRCECPDWKFRREQISNHECKHIIAVKLSQTLRREVSSTQVEIEEKPEECKICGSSEIIRCGKRKVKQGKKQTYLCKECGYRFVVEDGFTRMRADPKAITSALDLYFKGVSFRKVVEHLKMFYGLNVKHTTVMRWLRKYTDLIKGYVDGMNPQIGEIWHSDEMKVNINGKLEWVWNVMDEDTRFWIASQISHTREVQDARRILHEAKARVNKKPSKVVTDGLQSYNGAVKKEFFTLRKPRTEHIRVPHIRGIPNNNQIERLHGTVREREKVMRGLDSQETGQKIVEGKRVYYNFIRPHMGLDGKTPAEASGINLNLEGNKWMGIIKQSINPTPQTALGERAKDIVYAKSQDSETFKPKRWLDRKTWKEINSILRTFGYAWLSQGKDSLWIKPLDMHHSQRTTKKT